MLGILLLALFGGISGIFLYSAWAGVAWTIRGITIGGASGGVASSLVSGYTGMYVWLERGYNMESYGGLLLLIGLVCFCVVLVMNLILTGGRVAVQ
jgi:hypothetical protein